MSSNRSTTEGLRSACNYFCLSAGVIAHIKTEVIPELRAVPPEDMDDSTLESLEYLLLAQAQECFWQKAVMDGYKDASIAKLAAKVSDFYGAAGDWGVKSEAVSSEWIHHMTAKHHHFAAAAQYRQACDCLEKRKYGEEVARLRDSITCVNEALKESRYLNKIVLGDLNGLKNKVTEDLKRAEKDNDMIYLSRLYEAFNELYSMLMSQILCLQNPSLKPSIEPTWPQQKCRKKFRSLLHSLVPKENLDHLYLRSSYHLPFTWPRVYTKKDETDW